jgi:hypothetical protein
MRFVLALMSVGGTAHAILNQTTGPTLCGLPEPGGQGWVLCGFTSWDWERITCPRCRQAAEATLSAGRA